MFGRLCDANQLRLPFKPLKTLISFGSKCAVRRNLAKRPVEDSAQSWIDWPEFQTYEGLGSSANHKIIPLECATSYKEIGSSNIEW